MKKALLLIALLFFLFTNIFAQQFLGLRQSNYSGMLGSDLNPASIADSRYKVNVVLFSAFGSAYNNHLYFNTKTMPNWWMGSFDDTDPQSKAWMDSEGFGKIISVDSTASYKNRGLGQFFEIDNGKKNRSAFINTEIDVLNFMITLDKKRAIGFQIRNRTLLNIDDASPELIRLATNEFDFPNLFNSNIEDGKLNLSMNSWIEYNLNYAQVLSDREQHFFKIGGKLKFLQGVGSAYLHTNNLNINVANDTLANSIGVDFDYGYSENLGGYVESKNPNEEFSGAAFKEIASKLGLGVDIGVVYEWRPDWKKYKYDMDGEKDLWMRDKNKYKLKIGAAINDIGGMKYDKGGLSNNFSLNVNTFDLTKFDNIQGFRSMDSVLTSFQDSSFATFDNSDDKQFYMNLPTHFNLTVDYNIHKDFYLNFYSRINLVFSGDKNAIHYPTALALTPRWDHRRFGVSVPVSYDKISGFRTGLALRIAYVSIGTGDLKPLIAPGRDMNVRGLDVFVSAHIPILFKAPKDRDKDFVSDKLDDCIDVPGTWEMKGCSDVDHDGILDQNDSCVTDSGLVQFNGCPDTDGDGIMDKEDACPDTPGIVEFNGCPDTDGDGLMDKEDDCPTFPGPIENKGCPYKLLHTVDEMGEILETDTLLSGDEFYRFPNLKSDESHLFKQGEFDDSDMIKVILGNDTVIANKNDKGYYFYEYLPPAPFVIELLKEEEEILKAAFDNLEFEMAKAVIKDVSYKSLVDLANLLMKKPEWRIKISGHTDSVGKESNNLKLSQKRAEAVAAFLESNNVLKDRIDVEFFGESKPIATNKTKAGRQKNRRVEMEIL